MTANEAYVARRLRQLRWFGKYAELTNRDRRELAVLGEYIRLKEQAKTQLSKADG